MLTLGYYCTESQPWTDWLNSVTGASARIRSSDTITLSTARGQTKQILLNNWTPPACGERERDRDRETDRQRQRETETDRDRQ